MMWNLDSMAVSMEGWQMVGMILQSLLFAIFLLPTMAFFAMTMDTVFNLGTKVCRCDEPAPTWRKAYRTGGAVFVAVTIQALLVVVCWTAVFTLVGTKNLAR